MTIRCYKNPNRTQVDSAEVGGSENGSRGSDSENEGYMRETQIKSEVKRKGRGYKRGPTKVVSIGIIHHVVRYVR